MSGRPPPHHSSAVTTSGPPEGLLAIRARLTTQFSRLVEPRRTLSTRRCRQSSFIPSLSRARLRGISGSGRALLDQPGQLRRDPDDLEDADAALVARPAGTEAALGAVEDLARVEAVRRASSGSQS